MSRKLKNLDIKKLALVRRGANRVNCSVLKSDDKGIKGKIFKEESSGEAYAKEHFGDFEDLKKSSEILIEISDIYQGCKDEETRNLLGELLKHYDEKLPEIKTDKPEIRTVTASELLKEL